MRSQARHVFVAAVACVLVLIGVILCVYVSVCVRFRVLFSADLISLRTCFLSVYFDAFVSLLY